MGVRLWDILPRKEISLPFLKGKTLAVDASPILYQFLSSIRQPDGTLLLDEGGRVTSHLMGISTRIPKLMEAGVRLCFCFDGKPPILKQQEQENRAHRKKVAAERLATAKEEGDVAAVAKYSRQVIFLNEEVISQSKELLRAFGIPFISCPGEAEAQAAHICKKGDAYAVLSQDSDAFLYETPRLIRNLTVSSRRRTSSGTLVSISPEFFELSSIYSSLSLTREQLLGIAILTGTDYNVGGVPGIGAKKALKLVHQYPYLSELFSHLNAPFSWQDVLDVFEHMPILKDYSLSWSFPDADLIWDILVIRHNFSEERVSKLISLLNALSSHKQRTLGEFP
ncbi:flap structure-specific endonuclease [Candidatus Woesearchaeota archaeon]|nr:flap structure-specific endonuclease [Candidatus Woesearchaeota archaeon]